MLTANLARALVESGPDAIFLIDREGRIVFANARAGATFGYETAELVGQPVELLVSPCVRPEHADQRAAFAKALRARRTRTGLVLAGRRRDGTEFPVELSLSPVRTDSATFVAAAARDASGRRQIEGRLREAEAYVTEHQKAEDDRRRIEAALRRSEAALNQAQRVAHLGSWEWDLRSNEFSRSTEMKAIFGTHPTPALYPPTQLADLVVLDDRASLLHAVERALREKGSFAIETRVARTGRGERTILHQGEVIVEDRVAVRFVGTCTDITERKCAEREHQESLRWLQALLDQAAVGMLLVRGPPDCRIEPNARALEMLGRPVGAVRDLSGLLESPDGRALAPSELPTARALLGERIEATEYLLHHPRGVIAILASAVPILGPDRKAEGAVVAFLDISASKELERQRVEWSAIVAHDLRQPIHTIGISAQMLARLTDDEKVRRPVGQIRTAARRLDRMVEDLMDLSRLEARRLELTCHSMDVPATVGDVIQRLGPIAPDRRFEVTVQGSPPPVYADPDRVAQIVENLLTNAVKYGRAGTPIVVDIARSAGDVAVSVTNEGKPITDEEQAQMFRRFQRSAGAKLMGVRGAGLGLYIARELVEAHGGGIAVQCTPTGTATFRFTLPVAASEPGSTRSAASR